MRTDARIFVAGHRGLVGSALCRRLAAAGYTRILTATRDTLDLRSQSAVTSWFDANRPEYVFHAAGTVGGILANSTRPAEFIHDNLLMHATVVDAAHRFGATKLLYLGSSCVYPRECAQPINEDYLLTGPLEPTNEPYALAKISGIKLCQAYRKQYGCDFISVMPTNLYGPHDNFDLRNAHVLPALIRKCYEAASLKQMALQVWGDGTPRREFLHVDDAADACVFLMQHYSDAAPINVGTGEEVSIRQLAECVRDIANPQMTLTFDSSKPNGSPRKLLDVTRLHQLGWKHSIDLATGISATYQWFADQIAQGSPLPRGMQHK